MYRQSKIAHGWALIEQIQGMSGQSLPTQPDATLNRMTLLRRSATVRALLMAIGTTLAIGCASPGPPRPPSLRLPQPVRDLTALRKGDTVELSFTVPSLSTDKLPLRGGSVRGVLCRELEHQGCVAVAGLAPSILTPSGEHTVVIWLDALPLALRSGPPRLMSYRVEFFSDAGRSAGKSEAAYTIAGLAPPAVTRLHAEGSRLGVVLRWTPESATEGQVLLQREDLAPKPSAKKPKPAAKPAAAPRSAKLAEPNVVWLKTNALDGRTLDAAAEPGTPYRYHAVRQRVAQIGGRSLTYRSAESDAVDITLQEIYPPLAPFDLTAAGFSSATASFAVDLIWQPSDDKGLLAGIAGYNVYRETLNDAGHATDRGPRLNSSPVPLPSFHDTTAQPGRSYRYSVTAVDNRGNESEAATFVLEPSTP